MKRFLTYFLAFNLVLPTVAFAVDPIHDITLEVEEIETPNNIDSLLLRQKFAGVKYTDGELARMDVNAELPDTDDPAGDLVDVVKDLAGGEIDPTQVINYGLKIWEVIKANAPVVNQNFTYANAMPKGVKNAFELEGASPYQYQSFRVSGKNLYGMTVYDVVLTLAHQYGAKFDGKGAYITSAAVIPSDLSVLWGYTFDLNVKEINVANTGTKDSPVASLGLELNFTVSTPLQTRTFRRLVEFLGDNPKSRVIR